MADKKPLQNRDSVVTDIPNAKVKAVTERVVQEFQLAADKVAAHHAEPAKYPMPADKNATEYVLAERFAALPEGLRKKAADKVTADLKSGAARTKRLGDLAKVDLRSATPVSAQVGRLPFPDKLRFPKDELSKVPASLLGDTGESVESAGEPIAQAAAVEALHKLELRVHRVKALETTSEVGKDEIHLGGASIDESGDTHQISKFKVRDFNNGDVQTYSPAKQFTWFSLTENTVGFPKSYFVTVVLAEADWGGFAEYLNKLLDSVKSKVIEAVKKAVGGVLGAPGGPVGILIGIAVSVAVNYIFDFLKNWWGDEVFKPLTVQTVIPSYTSRWAGQPVTPQRTITYAGFGGKYEVVYDLRMFN
ncbi:hypothetical protein [Streptomyces sp. 2A115]|uniref:hypothetical protein n=1 Tax=Streptomyces sp. 2A115 TaxID=3457439 RepID=UPI003FD4DA2A